MQRVLRAITILGLTMASLVSYPQVPPDGLTEAIVQNAGMHLPPNMTLPALSHAQAATESHALVTIDWDVIPGAPERIREIEVKNWPSSAGTLKLRSFVPNLPAGPGRIFLTLPNSVFLFAVTSSNEVRGISLNAESRWEGSEHGVEGGFRTKLSLEDWIPNDPEISKIAVFEPTFEGRVWGLRKIGEVQLPPRGTESR
jgi:hypothetical protein